MSKFVMLLCAAVLVLGCSSVTAPDTSDVVGASVAPPELEGCNHWGLFTHPSYVIEYFTDSLMEACATPVIVNMTHHPTDPCTFGVIMPPGAVLVTHSFTNYNTTNCNPPIVVSES